MKMLKFNVLYVVYSPGTSSTAQYRVKAATEVLGLAMKLQVAPPALLHALLHNDRGSATYECIKAPLHRWLLFNASDLLEPLLQTLTAPYRAQGSQAPQGALQLSSVAEQQAPQV